MYHSITVFQIPVRGLSVMMDMNAWYLEMRHTAILTVTSILVQREKGATLIRFTVSEPHVQMGFSPA